MANKKRNRSKSSGKQEPATLKTDSNEFDQASDSMTSKNAENLELPPVGRLPIPFWVCIVLLVGFLSFLASICYRITY